MNKSRKGKEYEQEVNRLFKFFGWETERSMLSRGINDATAKIRYCDWRDYDRIVRNIFEYDGYTVTENKQKNFKEFKMRARRTNRQREQRTTYYSIEIDEEEGIVTVKMQMKKNKLKRNGRE